MTNLETSLFYTDKDNIIFGNNRILCFGICITGDDLWSRIIAFIALLFPCIYFNSTTLVWYYNNYGLIIPISVLFLDVILFVSYIAVSISDPGIIPRHDPYKTFHDSLTDKKSKGVIPYIEIPINGIFLRIKYCKTCNIYRNPRTIHCNSCDVCVDRFDHHCKWLGNCIGSRNYGIFYFSITILFILAIYMQILCCYTIAIASIYGNEGYRIDIIQASLCQGYLVLTFWFILGLFIYHTYLICTNQTTNEQLKEVYGDFNPWDKGTMYNIYDVLFRKKMSTHYYHPKIKNKIYCQNYQRLDNLIVNKDLEAQQIKKKSSKMINIDKSIQKDSEISTSVGVYGNKYDEIIYNMDNECKDVENENNSNQSKMSSDTLEESMYNNSDYSNSDYSNSESVVDSSIYGSINVNYRYNPLYDLSKINKNSKCSVNIDKRYVIKPTPSIEEGYNVSDKSILCLNSTVVGKNINQLCDAID